MRPSARRWLWLAAVAGLLHAASSAYWALGGTWLADTIGRWAIEWYRAQPTTAMTVLLVVAVVKAGVAIGPVVNETRPLPGYRVWRALCWCAGWVLFLYGLANTVGAWLVLAGLVRSDAAGTDPVALLGHAWIWDPLFALWGAALLVGLVLTRGRPRDRIGMDEGPASRSAEATAPGRLRHGHRFVLIGRAF